MVHIHIHFLLETSLPQETHKLLFSNHVTAWYKKLQYVLFLRIYWNHKIYANKFSYIGSVLYIFLFYFYYFLSFLYFLFYLIPSPTAKEKAKMTLYLHDSNTIYKYVLRWCFYFGIRSLLTSSCASAVLLYFLHLSYFATYYHHLLMSNCFAT
jgi:hypothetical protein